MKTKTILATAALPYANGEVHLGHLLEHLQVDIWCRSQRMSGHDCGFICADDTHGTPIMIRAREEGITPEQLITRAHQEHEKDFKDLLINHSVYSSTNSPENKELCEEFYSKMKAKGHITTRPVEQQYCTHDKMLLPDRFVKGNCPNCGALDQYGDSCEVCGATYNPSELKNPHCYLCGTEPIKKSSDDYFFKLNDFKDYLIDWLPKHTQSEVGAKMMEWFNEPLRDWDISRDAPYFGFAIPGAPDKFFYVWVDAPMGYVASTKIYCKQSGKSFDDYWRTDTKADVYHFIGKDITSNAASSATSSRSSARPVGRASSSCSTASPRAPSSSTRARSWRPRPPPRANGWARCCTSSAPSAARKWTAAAVKGKRVGDTAVELGLITRDKLFQIMGRQAEEIVYNTLLVGDGMFYFLDRYDETRISARHSLSSSALLMEGVRRMDEMSYFRERIPSDEHVPVQALGKGPPTKAEDEPLLPPPAALPTPSGPLPDVDLGKLAASVAVDGVFTKRPGFLLEESPPPAPEFSVELVASEVETPSQPFMRGLALQIQSGLSVSFR